MFKIGGIQIEKHKYITHKIYLFKDTMNNTLNKKISICLVLYSSYFVRFSILVFQQYFFLQLYLHNWVIAALLKIVCLLPISDWQI